MLNESSVHEDIKKPKNKQNCFKEIDKYNLVYRISVKLKVKT